MRMHANERERRYPALMLRIGTKQFHSWNFLQALERILRDLMFVCGDVVQAYGGKIICRRAEADRFCDGRSSSLEFMRQGVWTK